MVAQLANERLDERSSENNHAAPYPEFAEYDCLSCHQTLRFEQSALSTSRGEPAWNPWALAGISRKLGRSETLRLQMELNESNLAGRQQLLADLARTADEAARKAYREPTRTKLRPLLTGAAPISDVHDALISYLELRAGWQDPEIRDALPQTLVQTFEQELSALGNHALRLGNRGESLLNPVSEFDAGLFQQRRQGLLQLLEKAP